MEESSRLFLGVRSAPGWLLRQSFPGLGSNRLTSYLLFGNAATPVQKDCFPVLLTESVAPQLGNAHQLLHNKEVLDNGLEQ